MAPNVQLPDENQTISVLIMERPQKATRTHPQVETSLWKCCICASFNPVEEAYCSGVELDCPHCWDGACVECSWCSYQHGDVEPLPICRLSGLNRLAGRLTSAY